MTFDWIGEGFMYGQKLTFFQITTQDVPLVFSIHEGNDLSDYPFLIERVSKNINAINIEHYIEEEVTEVYMIETDRDFRRSSKRSYYLMKFVTKYDVLTVGAYTDNDMKMEHNNLYILCEQGYINILAQMTLIESTDQIKETAFENLIPLFDKKELAQELLRE